MPRFIYAQLPEPLILDPHVSPLEIRAYAYLDLRAGKRGHWDDTFLAMAEALQANRSRLATVIRRLVERGLVVLERISPWRWRFLLPERLRPGAQLALDEHPPETLRRARAAAAADSPRAMLLAPAEPGGGSERASSADHTFFRSQTSTPQTSLDPSADADATPAQLPERVEQQEPDAEPTTPPAEHFGLATQHRGRGRLDGLHERYHARLMAWGLGQPATASEWRQADAKVLEWARLEPRATAAALDATERSRRMPADATEADRPWTREESEARRLAIDAEVLGRRVAS